MSQQQKVGEFCSLYRKEFDLVSRLDLLQETFENVSPVLNLELELISATESFKKIVLTFYGVRKLKLEQPAGSLFTIPLLEITQIVNRQWEDLKFEVKDADGDSLEFLCRDFDFRTGA